jgi:hypothetical protein
LDSSYSFQCALQSVNIVFFLSGAIRRQELINNGARVLLVTRCSVCARIAKIAIKPDSQSVARGGKAPVRPPRLIAFFQTSIKIISPRAQAERSLQSSLFACFCFHSRSVAALIMIHGSRWDLQRGGGAERTAFRAD